MSGRIICGARHLDDVMRSHAAGKRNLRIEWRGAEQGFIDQFGNFLTRERAWKVAAKAGQIRNPLDGRRGYLFSEHLY